MSDTYLTLSSRIEALYKEKSSKFLAIAFPISSFEDFKTELSLIKKKYFDATHHCYACIINPENPVIRSNDDGEPSGTAGAPIAGQLQSFKLCNTAIIIVRYFGGTKLGTGGLKQAYKQSALLVLQQASLETRIITEEISITCPFDKLHDLLKVLKQCNGQLIQKVSTTEYTLKIAIPKSKKETLVALRYISLI